MAIPIAFSEELWRFGETLPILNIVILFFLSLVIQGFYTYFSLFQSREKHISQIIPRIVVSYILTFFAVGVILIALNRIPFDSDLALGLKRIIILCFPASLGGVIVDGLDKE